MTTTHSRTVQTRRRKAKAKKKDLREAKAVKKLGRTTAKAAAEGSKAGAA
jgi:hypothetical protein